MFLTLVNFFSKKFSSIFLLGGPKCLPQITGAFGRKRVSAYYAGWDGFYNTPV